MHNRYSPGMFALLVAVACSPDIPEAPPPKVIKDLSADDTTTDPVGGSDTAPVDPGEPQTVPVDDPAAPRARQPA